MRKTVNVSAQVIHNLEVGANKKSDPEILKGLCFALECTSDYLFGLSDNPQKTKDELIDPIIRASEVMAGYTEESINLFFQDRELAKLMFECSERLTKKDMKLLGALQNQPENMQRSGIPKKGVA